jgi:ABC-type Fe3+-hydroxamate transport system substrate-binding protein
MQYIDQIGNSIYLKEYPQRIISVVPSQTELLFDLGMDKKVVGITKFCIHPKQWFQEKTRVGGTKKLDIEKIKALSPDLIIANKEENTKEDILELQKYFPVWVSDIYTISDALNMIQALGNMLNTNDKASEIALKIKNDFIHLKKHYSTISPKKVAYFIWNNPMMVAGSPCFINEILKHCKLINVFENKGRYPEISIEELKKACPELILLSSEPFPFKEKHCAYYKQICPNAEVKIVDGELFSWYGSRLTKAYPYLSKLF